MGVAIAIIAILIVAAITLVVSASNWRPATGRLSRETRQHDAAARSGAGAPSEDAAGARARAGETRAAAEGGVPAVREPATVTKFEPVDEEELGVTRRHFLNVGVLASVGFGLAAFGGAALAFIWPVAGAGAGGKVKAGKLSAILAEIKEKKQPYYVPEARSYVQAYPVDDVARAEEAGYPDAVIPALEQGYIVQSQKCPHLGCRVPWCQTSQWYECPCHGSKYNAVGEKRDGPAPRGLSLMFSEVSEGELVINSALNPLPGMPIGTDTTEQRPEGPSCI